MNPFKHLRAVLFPLAIAGIFPCLRPWRPAADRSGDVNGQ
jgi:hypothetical protein